MSEKIGKSDDQWKKPYWMILKLLYANKKFFVLRLNIMEVRM